MEDQIHDAAVIATNAATATGVVNEDALHLLEPSRHGFPDAPFASPAPAAPATRVEGELRHSMAFALSYLDGAAPGRRWRASGLTNEGNRGSGFAACHEHMFPSKTDAFARAGLQSQQPGAWPEGRAADF